MLQYEYLYCVSKFLGICLKNEGRTEYYNLADPETNKTLRDMGFVLKVRERK